MLFVGKRLYLGAQARTHGIMLFNLALSVASGGHVPGHCLYYAWLPLTHRDTPRRCFWKRALLQTSSVRPINQISRHDPCERAPLGEGAEREGRCREYKTTDAALKFFGSPQQLLLD
jgi:hypothetical protein